MLTPLPAPLRRADPDVLVATLCGTGLLRPGPGTWGSAVAVFAGWALMWWGGWPLLLAATVLITPLGIWAAGRVERRSGAHDHGFIVIDEVAGQWLALLPAGLDPFNALIAFVLFRLLDIIKPGPIGWLDRRVPGGWGVMVDDLLAGLLAAMLLCAGRWVAGGFVDVSG
jgi:phosphatidylglycerophosphatase A